MFASETLCKLPHPLQLDLQSNCDLVQYQLVLFHSSTVRLGPCRRREVSEKMLMSTFFLFLIISIFIAFVITRSKHGALTFFLV